jgi:hypothetical protein
MRSNSGERMMRVVWVLLVSVSVAGCSEETDMPDVFG